MRVSTDEHLIEAAEAAAACHQEGEIARIHRALGEPGAADCSDCGAPIGAARRKALPSARRCIACQHSFELAGFNLGGSRGT